MPPADAAPSTLVIARRRETEDPHIDAFFGLPFKVATAAFSASPYSQPA